MTRTEWEEVAHGLDLVPAKARTAAWKRARELVRSIVEGKSDLAPPLAPDGIRFSVACALCAAPIKVGEEHVYRSTGKYVHYDCFHRFSE